MSYNIDSVEIVSGELQITPARLEAFCARNVGALPEGMGNPEEILDGCRIEDIPWFGEGSGNAYELLLEFLAECDGKAALLLCWEGGDSYGGLLVNDGKVTQGRVVMSVTTDGELAGIAESVDSDPRKVCPRCGHDIDRCVA